MPASSSSASSNGRAKRKAKEKPSPNLSEQLPVPEVPPPEPSVEPGAGEDEEEEQGITRCVCGSTGEDDPDAGEFMVQCETCKVWQHGLCMGYESEDQLHDDDYYCEQCRPELHTELLKKLSRKARQSSTNSHHTTAPTSSRLSRSHSPTHFKQPSKRRNTMNSRDAAFDENLKEVLEATAAEAGANSHDTKSVTSHGAGTSVSAVAADGEEIIESASIMITTTTTTTTSRNKRKRGEVESISAKKRPRSESSTPDQATVAPIAPPEDPTPSAKTTPAPAPPTKGTGRNKRGGRKTAAPSAQDSPAILDPNEGQPPPPPAPKRGNGRGKGGGGAKRPPQSTTSGQGANHSETPSSRRGQNNASGNAPESGRAYRNSHAFVVSQQPLYTSWNLPDYLAHLEEMLPTDVPRPLEVHAGGRGVSIERTMERGVKVKWPSKRTSVVDMNKRVRALVEWVGKEQASASDRARRREALEKALKESQTQNPNQVNGVNGDIMAGIDSLPSKVVAESSSAVTEKKISTSMTEMEVLMEELINFQERFGPGVKRERKAAAVA
ncbi:hypothetical protein K435DRAFT_879828 [Dendrothele bispora CBS 962.96]|uniref:PHD-type domain-containing protein n=1 Tax=Dendrothele bispora (strain CBS 962.96) TaxID=1314807 RepID=A0A4S8KKH6_DENBC|nr:hypothetical protein K435DRAFT_879828 [Dendrothele bispora CBS 962.96]